MVALILIFGAALTITTVFITFLGNYLKTGAHLIMKRVGLVLLMFRDLSFGTNEFRINE